MKFKTVIPISSLSGKLFGSDATFRRIDEPRAPVDLDGTGGELIDTACLPEKEAEKREIRRGWEQRTP